MEEMEQEEIAGTARRLVQEEVVRSRNENIPDDESVFLAVLRETDDDNTVGSDIKSLCTEYISSVLCGAGIASKISVLDSFSKRGDSVSFNVRASSALESLSLLKERMVSLKNDENVIVEISEIEYTAPDSQETETTFSFYISLDISELKLYTRGNQKKVVAETREWGSKISAIEMAIETIKRAQLDISKKISSLEGLVTTSNGRIFNDLDSLRGSFSSIEKTAETMSSFSETLSEIKRTVQRASVPVPTTVLAEECPSPLPKKKEDTEEVSAHEKNSRIVEKKNEYTLENFEKEFTRIKLYNGKPSANETIKQTKDRMGRELFTNFIQGYGVDDLGRNFLAYALNAHGPEPSDLIKIIVTFCPEEAVNYVSKREGNTVLHYAMNDVWSAPWKAFLLMNRGLLVDKENNNGDTCGALAVRDKSFSIDQYRDHLHSAKDSLIKEKKARPWIGKEFSIRSMITTAEIAFKKKYPESVKEEKNVVDSVLSHRHETRKKAQKTIQESLTPKKKAQTASEEPTKLATPQKKSQRDLGEAATPIKISEKNVPKRDPGEKRPLETQNAVVEIPDLEEEERPDKPNYVNGLDINKIAQIKREIAEQAESRNKTPSRVPDPQSSNKKRKAEEYPEEQPREKKAKTQEILKEVKTNAIEAAKKASDQRSDKEVQDMARKILGYIWMVLKPCLSFKSETNRVVDYTEEQYDERYERFFDGFVEYIKEKKHQLAEYMKKDPRKIEETFSREKYQIFTLPTIVVANIVAKTCEDMLSDISRQGRSEIPEIHRMVLEKFSNIGQSDQVPLFNGKEEAVHLRYVVHKSALKVANLLKEIISSDPFLKGLKGLDYAELETLLNREVTKCRDSALREKAERTPGRTEKTPGRTEKTPSTTRKTPSTTGKTPGTTGKTPSTTGKTPSRSTPRN